MITNNTSNPRVNFTSTLVPYSNKPFAKIVDSVSDCFQLRGYGNLKQVSVWIKKVCCLLVKTEKPMNL